MREGAVCTQRECICLCLSKHKQLRSAEPTCPEPTFMKCENSIWCAGEEAAKFQKSCITSDVGSSTPICRGSNTTQQEAMMGLSILFHTDWVSTADAYPHSQQLPHHSLALHCVAAVNMMLLLRILSGLGGTQLMHIPCGVTAWKGTPVAGAWCCIGWCPRRCCCSGCAAV